MIDSVDILKMAELAKVDPSSIRVFRTVFINALVPGLVHTFSAIVIPRNTFFVLAKMDIDSYPTIVNIAHPEWRVPYSWIDPLYLQWVLNGNVINPGTGSPFADYRLFMNDQFNVFDTGNLVLKAVVNTTTINGNAINSQQTSFTLKGYFVPKTQGNSYLTRISETRFAGT